MNYDVWFGDGEDRRRIETEVTPQDDASFKWLCNGYLGRQAMIMKYRVTAEDPSPPPPPVVTTTTPPPVTNPFGTSGAVRPHADNIGFAHAHVLALFLAGMLMHQLI